MSPDPSAVLLPKLFPAELLKLGQLLPNPLKPSVFNFSGSLLPVSADLVVAAEPESPYSTFVSLEREGRLKTSLTKFIGLDLGAKQGNFLKIDADAMQYNSLKKPEDLFKSICDDDAAKAWINSMALNKKAFYFVVGLQELKEAKFQRVILKEGSAGAHIIVPLEHTGQLPIEANVKVSGKGFGKAESTVSGIFGIEVRRVKSKVKKAVEPNLTDEISWVFSHEKTKGAKAEDATQVSVQLGEPASFEELEQLLKVSEDDEDEE
jgi:hypothetical protein